MKSLILFVPEFREGTQIINGIERIAKDNDLSFEVVYVKKEVNPLQQQQFLYAVHVADIVVVDCTIPSDSIDGGVYPALTAQVNLFNHVIVISENCLPLNITPYRGVYPKENDEIISSDRIVQGLSSEIETSLREDTYKRIPEDMIDDFLKYQEDMEKMLGYSFNIRKKPQKNATSVMISYRNSHSAEVENFKKIIIGEDESSVIKRKEMGCDGKYELKVLPPASLCGADEAHTPMRRWMLVGLLEDHIREVDEVWVYESRDDKSEIDYTNSWWTIAEMIMVANLNYGSEKQIRVRVYKPNEEKFYEVTPQKYLVELTEEQHKRLARVLSNTRPDTMGPECLAQVKQLKKIATFLRLSSKEEKQQMLDNLRENFEMSVPKTLPREEREKMIDDAMMMYSDPDEIERYANDEVFKEEFWNDISYQTDTATSCFVSGEIDVDKFLSIPMIETTGHPLSDFAKASQRKDGLINLGSMLHPKHYKVTKANTDRYLWLATRMGRPTVKDGNAPGLERIPIYNIKK